MISLNVNGVQHRLDIDPSTPLLYVLRNDLKLHGAKFGCGMGQCGACTVIVDGEATFSCVIPVSAIGPRPVRTLESLGTAEHPGLLQHAFIKHQAAQCGYCIAGMIMRAQSLLERNPHPTEQEVRAHMEPNLCRCGTHTRILAAIREVAGLPEPEGASATAQLHTQAKATR
ncbi:(2Fe-2S)-binding protein [Trinickia diaoshuihuensis]|jgi:aerobic-type carbon monoxide dehydrogenase small subunit (CoxS/CutS family)|uniref:(2Fe-2S)-binding protein n=1 Tax=Trinickia diaoshuihuensis TaxID=2292265 RepID=UPI000E24D773|nr:(2Fe-2S)-binding protein [Trinickia diaoshuihuensis]